MINEERLYIMKTIMKIPVALFKGTLEDLTQFQGLFAEPLPWNQFAREKDEFLEKLYGAHVQVIGECFTCFRKDKPMRLIKLSETSIRIICDTCRENLHSAQSN